MGAQYSSMQSTAPAAMSVSCESSSSSSSNSSMAKIADASAIVATASSTPPQSSTTVLPPMPQLQRPETFEEKLYRKFKAEPLVPIGCLTTAYFLGSGIHSFYQRNPAKSQTMMRLRVASQFATILIFIGYAGMNSFTLQLAPGMAVPSEQGFGPVGAGGSGKQGNDDGGEEN